MYSTEIKYLFGDQGPTEFTGDLQFCEICGGLIHPRMQDQHTNYHLTIQRILEDLTKQSFKDKATNVWLDLENLKNGELT